MNCPYQLIAMPTQCVVRTGNSVVAPYDGPTGARSSRWHRRATI